MAKAWWLLVVLSCACSDPDSDGESGAPAGSLTVTLSDPGGGRACTAASTTPYRLGSEDAPLTDGEGGSEVSCAVHSTETDSWFSGRILGKETGGADVIFSISNEDGLVLAFASSLTGALELDPSMSDDCVPTFTATIGNAVTSDFDCPLLVDPTNATTGCGLSGTVTFENCSM